MSYELVVWEPSVGGSGDDLYNIPGAVKLDGTNDPGDPILIRAGGSFSDPPTWTEIDASASINQVRALLNYLLNECEGVYHYQSGPSTPLDPITPDLATRASESDANESLINSLRRTVFGLSDYSFLNSAQVERSTRGRVLADQRKAISALSQVFFRRTSVAFSPVHNFGWMEADGGATYPGSPVSWNLIGDFNGVGLGTHAPMVGEAFISSRYRFGRTVLTWRIPDLRLVDANLSSVNLNFSIVTTAGTPGNIEIYQATTPELSPWGTNVPNNTDTLLGSIAISNGAKVLSIPVSTFVAWQGNYVTLILRSSKENTGTAPTTTSGNGCSIANITNPTAASRPAIEVNFA